MYYDLLVCNNVGQLSLYPFIEYM